MSIHEECGVFGVMAQQPEDVASLVYFGLYSLQHRGQESCGIVVNDDGVFVSHKDIGLVGEVFTGDILHSLPAGTMAVGHTRYGTTGGTNRNNCQPIEVNHQKGHMALAHNGNLSNAAELRSALEMKGAIFHTSSDTETIAYIITQERLSAPSIEEEADLREGSIRLPSAELRAERRRNLDRRVGKLRAARGGRKDGPGCGTGRNYRLQQGRCAVPEGTLRPETAAPLYL